MERLLGEILPLRPYRCNSCEHRYWSWIKPLFNLSRGLFVALVFVALLWLGSSVALKLIEPSPGAVSASTTQPQESLEASDEEAAAEDRSPNQGELPSEPASAQVATALDEETLNAPFLPPAESPSASTDALPQASSAPTEESEAAPATELSPFVQQQLARNQAREADTTAPLTEVDPPPEPSAASAPEKAETTPTSSVVPAPARSRTPGRITSLEIDDSGDSLVVRILGTNAMQRHKSFALAGDRLVWDLTGDWQLNANIGRALKLEHPLARQLRLGRHKRYLRLVFDLRGKPTGALLVSPIPNGLKLTLPPQ